MKKIYCFLLVLVACVFGLTVQAQQAGPVDFMRMNPYQLKAHPAADLPYESVMSLVIGNIGLDVHNTTLRYNNLFDFDAQGRPTAYNLRKLANSLDERNFVGLDVNLDIFTLYRRLKTGLLTIDYGVKAQADARFNDGLFQLLGYGNAAFVGDNHPAKVNADVNAMLYHELAVGYQWNLNERLSLGGRAKLLFGVGDVNTQTVDVKLFTDPESYALRLEEDILVRTSMPSAITLKDGVIGGNGGFSASDLFHNPGFGVDFGAEYRFNDRFSAVAAVRDLGFFRWSANNIEMKGSVHDAGQFYADGDFLFNGLDVNQLQLIVSDEAYRKQFLDTLQQYFKIDYERGERYTTFLNTNLLLRGNYDLDAYNRFSAQLQGCFYGSGFRPALTLAYNGNFYKKLDVCVTYTMMPGSYDNIGLGIAGRFFKTCNVYLTTNNVIGLFKPMNASAMNLRLGIVFVLRPEDNDHLYD
ncbi:MAG: hypothetical protein IJ622_00560 [Bacteroidales bacterium]|nr:hypothetical protein [Bacteroidales bacterium]